MDCGSKKLTVPSGTCTCIAAVKFMVHHCWPSNSCDYMHSWMQPWVQWVSHLPVGNVPIECKVVSVFVTPIKYIIKIFIDTITFSRFQSLKEKIDEENRVNAEIESYLRAHTEASMKVPMFIQACQGIL